MDEPDLNNDVEDEDEGVKVTCPHCGTVSVAADDGMHNSCRSAPSFEDLLFCFTCGNLSKVDNDDPTSIRKANDEEIREHGDDEIFVQARRMRAFAPDSPLLAASLTALSR